MSDSLSFVRSVATCLLLWLLGVFYFFDNAGSIALHLSLEADNADIAQTYYSYSARWNETDSTKTTLNKGVNNIAIPLPGFFIGGVVRFDPGQKPGTFRLTNAFWTVDTRRIPIAYPSIVNSHTEASEITSSDTDLRLVARDTDPQLIVPTPPLMERTGNVALALGFSFVALLALIVAAIRRVPLPTIAAGIIASCCLLYFYTGASVGPRLPLYDDWRYVLPGGFSLIDGWAWLRVVGNDTYFLTNQLFDFAVLKLTNVDFFVLRLAAVALLLLQIGLQIRILLRTTLGRPFVGAVAIAATIASLAAGAYWSDATIAYQQALPTLFGTMLLGFFLRADDAKLSTPTIVAIIVCCLASGLAYISGGVLLASLGAAAFVVYVRRSPALTRAGLLIFGLGVILFVVQFALVTLQQGSLLEHSHRAETVFPTDRRFWIFFVALFGRALGYKGLFLSVDILCAVVVLAPTAVLALRLLRGSSQHENVPRFWSLLALYAGIGTVTYAAIVAFGRAGFAPDTAATSLITSMGKGRFHFWPISAMLPYVWLGCVACLDRWPRRYARLVAAGVAVLLVVPKSAALLDNASRQRDTASMEREGARCIVAHLDDIASGRPVVCKSLTSLPINLAPTLIMLRDRHTALYARLLEEGRAVDNAAP